MTQGSVPFLPLSFSCVPPVEVFSYIVILLALSDQIRSDQSLSHVGLFVTP